MINRITLPAVFSPRDADNAVLAAALSGADSLIVRFSSSENPLSPACREKLLSVLRSAYRRKIKIYISDDSFPFSGTAFGMLGSVPDLRAKALFLVDSSELCEGEEPLAVRGCEAIVARTLPANEAYPFLHYPDLTLSESAQMVLDFVYRPFLKEYKKFVGYEFAGFVSFSPCFASPLEDSLPYSGEALALSGCEPFSLFENASLKAKYLSACQTVFEKNFLSPLKTFCVQNSLSFTVIPENDKSASPAFCKRENALDISPPSFSFADTVRAFVGGSEGMLELYSWDEYAERLSALRRFLADISPAVRAVDENEAVVSADASELFIVNTSEKTVKIRLSPAEGKIFSLSDFENGSLYRLDTALECEFSPLGFLYIVSADEAFYSDPLPVSVSGVRLRERSEKPLPLAFSEHGGEISFTLPDEPLFSKCLDFEGDFTALKVKMGSMERLLITPPFCVPLFDFCRGASCTAVPDGTVTKIFID